MARKIPPAPKKQTFNENPKNQNSSKSNARLKVVQPLSHVNSTSFEGRELAILREIRDMQIEIENLKRSTLSQTNIQTLENDFYREFQNLSKEVKENLEKNRHAVDRMEAEIKFLKEDIGRIISLEEEMKRMNMKSLTKDIESLKLKSQWLETNFKGFDIDPLIEKIQEIEDSIKIMKASQPLILE